MIPKLKEFNIVPSKNLDYLGWRQSLKVDDKNPLFTEKVVKIEHPRIVSLYKWWVHSLHTTLNAWCDVLRETVVAKLYKAVDSIPKDYVLWLFDAIRPLSQQKSLFDEWYGIYKEKHPTLSHKELFELTSTVVSPTKDIEWNNIYPPHSTWWAVDCMLLDAKTLQLSDILTFDDMEHPCLYFDSLEHMSLDVINSQLSHLFLATQDIKYKNISLDQFSEAQKTRRILYDAMTSCEFFAYPWESWHLSYWDALWAKENNKDTFPYW